jgi:hypothetical protein
MVKTATTTTMNPAASFPRRLKPQYFVRSTMTMTMVT